MPELPEVETVRRGLEPLLAGRRLQRVDVLDDRLVRPDSIASVRAAMQGRRVEAVRRRGKYLLLDLDGGITAEHHLRMTGSFAAPDQPEPAHVRLRYEIEGVPGRLRYNDPRRFGTLVVGDSRDVEERLDAKLGPEPLGPDWSAAVLLAATRRRSAPLKSVLLDQRVVAGLGNIYVDEACFLAGVRPDLSADRLTSAGASRLVDAVRQRLAEAIDAGGSTLRDYRGVSGEVGGMQERFRAYGRAGRPCLVCGATMSCARIAGRMTVWCPACQPASRRRR